MRMRRFVSGVTVAIVMALVAGCGGGSSAAAPEVQAATTRQMGGAIQGKPLVLSTAVSTVYRAPLLVDAWGGAPSADGRVRGVTTNGSSIYMVNQIKHTIEKMSIATGSVVTLAGQASSIGSTDSVDGTGSTARFYEPKGITSDGANLYVADSGNCLIRKINIVTGKVTTLAGQAGVPGNVDGVGTAAQFVRPHGITTDGKTLFVTDTGGSNAVGNAIRKVDIATGVLTTLTLVPIENSGGVVSGPNGTNLLFGITTDGHSLYACASWVNTIYKVVIATGEMSILAGSAAAGASDGIGPAAQFFNPTDITTDGTYLYVAEYGNSLVRKIRISSGEVTTVAGTVGSSNMVDGLGTQAAFHSPTGITTDGKSLFVLDLLNTLRKIN